MSRRKWQLSQFDKTLAARIAYEHSLDEFAVLMLISRGITDENEIVSFLSSDGEFSDPFDIKDMDKAVEAVNSAIENGDIIFTLMSYDDILLDIILSIMPKMIAVINYEDFENKEILDDIIKIFENRIIFVYTNS